MTIKREHLPTPPKVLEAFQTGFDAITRHISLALFPLALDLFIWFAPHLRVKQHIEQIIVEVNSLQLAYSPELEEVMQITQEMWQVMAERLNILMAIRSYPVGVFSFMTSLLPLKTPLGEPVFVEIPSLGFALLIGVLLTIGGVALGGMYFSGVAQAVLDDEVRWPKLFSNWLWNSGQALVLMLIWLALFVGAAVFGACLLFGAALFSDSFTQMVFLAYGAMVSWMLFPLFFSAHGIFVNKDKAWRSLIKGAQLTSMTFLRTSFFILIMILFGQGLNMLWQIPPEDSWLMLISVLGHAFVSTGALAASFVYYNDMAQWAQKMLLLQKAYLEEEGKNSGNPDSDTENHGESTEIHIELTQKTKFSSV